MMRFWYQPRLPCRSLSTAVEHTRRRDWLRQHGGGVVSLSIDSDARLAYIEVSNPTSRNALSGKMMAELGDLVDALPKYAEEHGLAGLVLHGAGGTFCSGSDLSVAGALATAATPTPPARATESDDKSVGEKGETGAALMCNYMQATLTSLAALPLVSVAAVDGYAIGGGSELATACDYRIVHARMGVAPGWGGGARLINIVGYQNALRIFTTGCPVKSKEALNIGFANDAFCTTATADNNNDNDNSNSSSHGYGGSLAAQVCDDAAQAGSRFLVPFLSVGEPHVIREIKRMTKEVECTTGRTSEVSRIEAAVYVR